MYPDSLSVWQLLTSEGPRSIRHDGAFPGCNGDNRGHSNLIWTAVAAHLSLPLRVCERVKCKWVLGGYVHSQANGVPFGNVTEWWGSLREKVKRVFESLRTWEGSCSGWRPSQMEWQERSADICVDYTVTRTPSSDPLKPLFLLPHLHICDICGTKWKHLYLSLSVTVTLET